MNSGAYIDGFRKTAEAYGIDSSELMKVAAGFRMNPAKPGFFSKPTFRRFGRRMIHATSGLTGSNLRSLEGHAKRNGSWDGSGYWSSDRVRATTRHWFGGPQGAFRDYMAMKIKRLHNAEAQRVYDTRDDAILTGLPIATVLPLYLYARKHQIWPRKDRTIPATSQSGSTQQYNVAQSDPIDDVLDGSYP